MNVSEVLKKAWSAVEDAGLPEEIRPVAFREAVRLLSPVDGASVPRGGMGGIAVSGGSNAGDGEVAVTEDEIYERVVVQTGVDRDKLEQLVHLDDDGPRISVPGLKLGKNNAARTRAVAQILTITRGFGLEESGTSVEVIRSECDRLKVYDSPNFSAHIKGLDGYVITGSGQNRRVRAKAPGIEAFLALVDSVLADS